MGCCESNKRNRLSKSEFIDQLRSALDSQNYSKVFNVFHFYSKSKTRDLDELNDGIFEINDKKLSPLAYCVYKGNFLMFTYLINLGCSISLMEKLLESQGLKAINIICANNDVDFLHEYLPFFMINYKPWDETDQTLELDQEKSKPGSISAIHTACKYGSLSVVNYLSVYFLKENIIPEIFNLHSIDEHGENCALISCRNGQYEMVKMLHDKFKADLNLLNFKKENAYMVTVCGYKKLKNPNFFSILKFLYEDVKVDICYMYEELLLVANDENMIKFIEEKLENKGIYVRKSDLELGQVNYDATEDYSIDSKVECIEIDDELRKRNENEKILSMVSRISDGNFELNKSTFIEAAELLES